MQPKILQILGNLAYNFISIHSAVLKSLLKFLIVWSGSGYQCCVVKMHLIKGFGLTIWQDYICVQSIHCMFSHKFWDLLRSVVPLGQIWNNPASRDMSDQGILIDWVPLCHIRNIPVDLEGIMGVTALSPAFVLHCRSLYWNLLYCNLVITN